MRISKNENMRFCKCGGILGVTCNHKGSRNYRWTEEQKSKLKGRKAWNEGLTKETDERVNRLSESVSKTMIEKHVGFQKGYDPWNKGLTKDNSDSVRRIGEAHIGNQYRRGRKQSPETCLKMSIGAINSFKNGRKSPVGFLGPHTEDAKRRIAISSSARAKPASPNKSEILLFNFTNDLAPSEYALNTKGEILVIGGKVPDIVNVNGKKKLIELFGYRHGERETGRTKEQEESRRIDFFKKFGWDTLVVWYGELKNIPILKSRILDFHRR